MNAKNLTLSILAGVATLASASTFAFDLDGFYVLGGVGVGSVDNTKFSGDDDVHGDGAVTLRDTEARADFAWRGGLGLWLTDNFAVEANYFGMSSHSDELIIAEVHRFELETSSLNFWDLTALGRYFLDENLWFFGRIGLAYSDKVTNQYAVVSGERFNLIEDDNGGMGAALAIGLQYDFLEWWGVRLEANTIQALNDNDMYAVTGNIVFNIPDFL